ncbi:MULTISPECIES: response regulator [Sphingomonas]|uniref:response regulator n=1 Tax=Sphingomonas TaxID=13687 RepID=UPI00083586BB|nr:response regulator [Sphingomonas sp. CCH10-B3]MBA3879403.1 response regulator [Sphingobium sp.]
MQVLSREDPNAAFRRGQTRTILAIDDSRTSLNVLGQQLAQHGYLVVLCESGAEALDLLAARGFDLVLCDLVMPGMSGLSVLHEIRSNRETADLPVIVITASGDPHAAVDVFKAGADDYVAKPFTFDVLAARIERVIARARRIAELKRSNATLDARIAARAMELGEARAALAETRADRLRLIASLQSLNDRVDALSGTSAA